MQRKSPSSKESVWDYPRPPRVEITNRRVRVIFQGETIAESRRAQRVLETSHPPVYYPLRTSARNSCTPPPASHFANSKVRLVIGPCGWATGRSGTPPGVIPGPAGALKPSATILPSIPVSWMPVMLMRSRCSPRPVTFMGAGSPQTSKGLLRAGPGPRDGKADLDNL